MILRKKSRAWWARNNSKFLINYTLTPTLSLKGEGAEIKEKAE
jgi:hypothetical protein